MCLISRSLPTDYSRTTSPDLLPQGVLDNPFKPLEFWEITSHDRESLVERIAPFMIARLPRAYSMQKVAADYGWPCRILSHSQMQTEHQRISCWQQVVTEFWKSPSHTTEKLLLLARAWFYTLLRYTYRTRFSFRGRRCISDPTVRDPGFYTNARYAAALTTRDIYQLTGIPNKYGAKFYRSCFKDVQQCSDWMNFCASISWFCKSIQFPTHSNSPEELLKELRGNLPSVILQRRWVHTATRLAKTSHLAMSTADHMERLDAQVTSEGSSSLKRMKEMEQEIGNLHAQYQRLSLACETIGECKQSIAALTAGIKKIRMNLDDTEATRHASSPLEDIVACRWLLENLPVSGGGQKGFGIQWRSFWKLQWNQYDDNADSKTHPLRKLKGDERYEKVGQNLYGTLSTMLHGYGHLRNISLHPDVHTLIKTIGPVHYKKDKQVDIEAERRRWLTGVSKVAKRNEMV